MRNFFNQPFDLGAPAATSLLPSCASAGRRPDEQRRCAGLATVTVPQSPVSTVGAVSEIHRQSSKGGDIAKHHHFIDSSLRVRA
jgi:hypothetical protein